MPAPRSRRPARTALLQSADRLRRLATPAYEAAATADCLLAGSRSAVARRLRWATKPLLMPALAARFTERVNHDDAAATVAAQACSWVGDVALLSESRRAFLIGLGAFAGAHGCYLVAFRQLRGNGPPESGNGSAEFSTTGLKLAAGLWLTTGPAMALAAGRRDPALRLPVLGYSVLLAAMFAASTTVRSDPRVAAGSALFLLSDTLLGVQEFALERKRPALESAVMASYTLGQWLIAEGVTAALGRRSRGR